MRSWIISIALLLTVYAAYPTPAHAQTSDNTFCYTTAIGSYTCFDTFEAAEAALRNALPASYKNVIQPKTPVPNGYQLNSQGLEQWRIDYYIPDQPPEATYPATHTISGWNATSNGICAPSNDPIDPDGCLDGDAAALAKYEYSRSVAPQCTLNKLGFEGAYAAPFSRINVVGFNGRYGSIQHTSIDYYTTRRLAYTTICPGWTSPTTAYNYIAKRQTFICPDKFSPVDGFSSLSESPKRV